MLSINNTQSATIIKELKTGLSYDTKRRDSIETLEGTDIENPATQHKENKDYIVLSSSLDPVNKNYFVEYLENGKIAVLKKHSKQYKIINEEINKYLNRDKDTEISLSEFRQIRNKFKQMNISFVDFKKNDLNI